MSVGFSGRFVSRSPDPRSASVCSSWISSVLSQHFLGGASDKLSACNAGNLSLIRGSGRSPGEGSGNSLQYPGLKDPTDRGAWWATVHGAAQSQTRLDTQLTLLPRFSTESPTSWELPGQIKRAGALLWSMEHLMCYRKPVFVP